MISRVHPRFRADFARLPSEVRERARDAYRRFVADPRHPGLRFKRLNTELNLWSVRINDNYRAVGVMTANEEIVWFFIGNHSEYERLLSGQ